MASRVDRQSAGTSQVVRTEGDSAKRTASFNQHLDAARARSNSPQIARRGHSDHRSKPANGKGDAASAESADTTGDLFGSLFGGNPRVNLLPARQPVHHHGKGKAGRDHGAHRQSSGARARGPGGAKQPGTTKRNDQQQPVATAALQQHQQTVTPANAPQHQPTATPASAPQHQQTATPASAPQPAAGQPTGATPPVVPAYSGPWTDVFMKWGIGAERENKVAYNAPDYKIAPGMAYYLKFAGGLRDAAGMPWLYVNFKIKTTPQGFQFAQPTAGLRSLGSAVVDRVKSFGAWLTRRADHADAKASSQPPSLQDRMALAGESLNNGVTSLGGALASQLTPKKVSIDLGLVIGKVEIGGSGEWTKNVTWWRPSTWNPSTALVYASLKDKDPLVDSFQVKFGKINIKEFALGAGGAAWQSIGNAWRTLTGTKVGAAADHERWQNALRKGELQFSTEHPLPGNPHALGNYSVKMAPGDFSHATRPLPATRLSGLAAGIGAGIWGANVTDRLIGQSVGQYLGPQYLGPEARKILDGIGGGAVGVAFQRGVETVVVPRLRSGVTSLLSKAAIAPVVDRVASAAAPVLAKAAPALNVVGRAAGPVSAMLAGVQDGADAYNNFKNGNTAGGWKSAARGALRVGLTAGCAIGLQILMPYAPGVAGVAGGVAGGFAADMILKLF